MAHTPTTMGSSSFTKVGRLRCFLRAAEELRCIAAAPRQLYLLQFTLRFTLSLCWSLSHSPGEGGRTELAKFAVSGERKEPNVLEVFDKCSAAQAAPAPCVLRQRVAQTLKGGA